MIHNEAMSENLVDDFKNLIPFVGGSFDIDWTPKNADYYNSDNPMTMNIGQGKLIVDCHLIGGLVSEFHVGVLGVFEIYAFGDAHASQTVEVEDIGGSVNNVRKFNYYPMLHVGLYNMNPVTIRAPIINISYQNSYKITYCGDFDLLVLRVA